MIKVRLLKILDKGAKYIGLSVLYQCLGLIAQIAFAVSIATLVNRIVVEDKTLNENFIYIGIALLAVAAKLTFDSLYQEASFLASVDVKSTIRRLIYEKVIRLGSSYKEYVPSSQIIQMMGEGVEQLEVYVGKYLGQFVYAILAPIILFVWVNNYNIKVALILLIMVPVIPIVIMVVMKVAKKILDKYFKIYYELGDTFLEKLQGMTTLKVYGADTAASEKMNSEAENFRRITMKVLSMQLNSTLAMDFTVYVGIALGITATIYEYYQGDITLFGGIIFLILASEFFMPMRLLGSYFHIGMNGMKAADRVFDFLDIEETKPNELVFNQNQLNLCVREMYFSRDEKSILKNISFSIQSGKLISIVGVSGSGKSTIAKVLSRNLKGYSGQVTINGLELNEIAEANLHKNMTMVSLSSYIFSGSIRENLLLGNPKADDNNMKQVLVRVNLWSELFEKGGLDLVLNDGGTNLSGGQRQRLVLARALLKESSLYIFDEVTSNIDMESEEIIMRIIYSLAHEDGKAVILISHRLANVVDSDAIVFLENGEIKEQGTHQELMDSKLGYYKLFSVQQSLENLGGDLNENNA